MKTKIKRHYRSVVSVLLSVCMLVSCMTVGLIATDAARVSDEESVGSTVTGPVIINGHLNNNSWTSATMYQKDGNYYYSVNSMGEGREWKFSNNNTEYGPTSSDESNRKVYGYDESNGKAVQPYQHSTFRNMTGNYSGGLTIWVNGTLTKTWITNGKTANPIDVTVSSVDNAVVSATQGSVTVNEGVTDKQFQKGSDATVTITPDAGYVPETLTVGSNTYTLSDLTKSGGDYTYTFTVPETATGTFTISTVMKRQIANSASILADPAEGASAKVTVTPTTPATNNLKYTLYDDADNSVVDTVTVTDGSAAEFTVTPTAKYTYYYAVLEENPNSGTYSTLTTDKVLITNTALREKHTVTFAANDPSKGTVTAVTGDGTRLTSGDKVFEGTVVTFTAIPKTKCLFKKWGDNSTTTPRDVTITGDTTVMGNFAYDGYELMYGSSSYPMKELDDGTYVSTVKVAKISGSADPTKRFTIRNLSNDLVAVSNDSDNTYWINDLNKKTGLMGSKWQSNSATANNIGKTWYNNTSSSAYVGFDPYTEKVWLSDNPQLARDVKIIAKNGTIRYQYNGDSHINELFDNGTTRSYGTTTITKKSGTVAGSVTDAYSNNAQELSITGPENGNGVTLTITTSSVKSEYYVKGWVVNGETYLCKDSSGNPITGTTSDGNYSFDYVVDKFPDTVNGRIEITPVYYSTRANYVGFYVTGYEMAKSDWGNTLAIYSYKGSAPLDGDWPGQPMLKINGRYYAQIEDDATGITLSNYVFDYVHNRTDKTMNLADNSTDKDKTIHQYQTYDFNDFKRIQTYKLAGQSNPEIIFSFKYKKGAWWNNTNNNIDNFYKFDNSSNKIYNYGDGGSPAYPNTANISDFKGPWEDLTNYYGKKVDIFETELTDAQLSNSAYYVVSNGYIKNEVGQYATDWIIYENHSGSLVKKYRFCSESRRLEALDSNGNLTGSYTSLDYLQGHPIKITYEFSNLSGFHDGERYKNSVSTDSSSNAYDGQPSYRGDGRWTYTEKRKVKAHVIIEYADNARSTFTRDYFQPNNYDFTSGEDYEPEPHTGLTTGTQAYFTDTSDPEKQTESEKTTKSNEYFNFKAEPDPDHEYTFIGWYLLDDGTYSLLDYNEDGTCSVKVDNNDVLVARFIKTPAGNVKLSHELMENSKSPDLGATFNSAEIVDSSNNTVTTITGNPIATDNKGTTLIKSKYIKADYAAAGYKLKITLKTTPETSPSAEFKSFYYDINKSDTQTKITGTGSLGGTAVNVDNINTSSTDKAATIYVPLSYFFDVQDGEYFFDISKDTLKFYSELEVPKRTVTIKKVLPDFVSDSSTGFSVHIKVSDTENGTYSDITGTFTSSIPANSGSFTDGKVAIHNGETITFAVDKNKYFKVTEENIPSPYEFDALYFTNDTSNNLGNGYKCLADSDKSFEVHNKVFANYTINYTYPSRFNNLTGVKLYGDQTYTVNGKIDSTDTNFDNYIDYTNSKVKKALVIAKNPFESDFMYDFVWDFDSVVYNPEGAEYTANVTTTTPKTQNVHVTFEFPYAFSDVTGADWTGTAKVYSAKSDNPAKTAYQSPAAISIGYQTVPYALEPYCDENNVEQTGYRIHCTTAPKKCGGNDFLYWSIREKAIGSDEWVEVAKCYTNEYTYATFNDYHVRPIFDGDEEADITTEENKSEATIKFLDTSRNQWNNNQYGSKPTSYAGQDMVYADFDVAYRYKGQDVDDSTDLKVGVLIENIGPIDQNYLLDHRNTTTADGKTAYTNSLNHYKDTTYYAYDAEAIKTYLSSVIKDGKDATVAQTTYQTSLGKSYTLNLKQRQPGQTLTNMNRVEYYHGSTVRSIANNADDKVNEWTVNNANTSGVFRAYSYIVDADGNVTLSEPTYYTLYGTATLDHLTTE